MKKTYIGIFIILALLPILALFLFACAKENNSGDSGGTDLSTDTSDNPEKTLCFVESKQCARIVYGKDAKEDEILAANSFADKLRARTGWNIYVEQESVYNAEETEIVFGNTTYPESQQVISSFECYARAVAKVVGSKLVVAVSEGANYIDINTDLVAYFIKSSDNLEGLNIPADYEICLLKDDVWSHLPIIADYELKARDSGDGCYTLDFTPEQVNVFYGYINSLVSNGFELYAKNTIDDNEYATYINEKLILTAIHTSYNDKYKLLIESRKTSGLPTRADDNKYTPVNGLATTLTQVGCFYDVKTDAEGAVTNFNGMSYVLRLADGSFIVVDGGHGGAQADNLYNVLKKQSPDPDNIVIAAWFFSHDHGDHMGFFTSFTEKYRNKVKVEQFIFNFPSKEQFDYELSEKVRSNIKTYFGKSTVIKAHPGQVFHIRDVKITMLYTFDVYDTEIKDTNNVSIVWKLEFSGGTTFMCFGDYAEYGKTILSLYSADTLKSDIVQVAHHGMWGQDSKLYSAVQPKYAFWPAGAWHIKYVMNNEYYYAKLDEIDVNTWFFTGNNIDSANIYLAADDICVMTVGDSNISVERYDSIDAYIK